MIHKSINVTTIADTVIALQIIDWTKDLNEFSETKINVHSSHQTTTIGFLSNIKKYTFTRAKSNRDTL